jgi:hypothetical protein
VNAAYGSFLLPAYVWQVALHSWVTGLIFYIWVRRLKLPSGRPKRWLLVVLLTLPLLTAAVPGRSAIEFSERIAWVNSARLLAAPIFGRVHVGDIVVVICAIAVALTVWQELVLRRSRTRIAISPKVMSQLPPDELELAQVLDEIARQTRGQIIALYVIRLVQSYNPAALRAFYDYRLQIAAACDARAAAGRDPHALARVLLREYQATDPRDGSALTLLRRRVDVLLGGGPQDASLPMATVIAAAIFMMLVLPWIV